MLHKKHILSIFILTVAIATVSYFLIFKNNKKDFIASQNLSQLESFLESPYNDIASYEEIFLKIKTQANQENSKAGIISHHFLAKELIADFYNKISSDKIKNVFLISPNHYNHFYPTGTLAYTSSLAWKTPYGNLIANNQIIDSIDKVEKNDSAIGLEHGIYVEIPFIRKFFPNAKIVPLVINLSANSEDLFQLGKQLNYLGKEDSILIVSSDFSHDIPATESSKQDKKSIEELKKLNKEKINYINSDCKQCFLVLSTFLENQNYKFNLIDNKNSFDYSNENQNSVTSYVSGFYSEKKDINILFTGDLMLDRGIRYFANKNGSYEFLFDKIYPLLSNQDLVVSNLEGPITNNKSISSGTIPGSSNNFIFTFAPETADTLYLENIKLVNLGNNHILNFSKSGLISTKNYLSKYGIEYFGAPNDSRSIVKEIEGIKIAFISYNEFFGSASLDEAQAIDEIQKLKDKTDFIIVLPHWGVEYTLEPTEEIKNMAHQFINAGADLVIGTHPHVIQSIENYNSKKIYYSLGNFIFDQYFEENVRNGLGVVLKINPNTKNITTEEINFFLQSNGQTIIK